MKTSRLPDSQLLVVNVGSSSCKVTATRNRVVTEAGSTNGSPIDWDAGQWLEFIDASSPGLRPDHVLHRFVHGGGIFHRPVIVDASVRRSLDSLVALAPLHTADALSALDALREAFPLAPAIACFDTSFHETIPPAAFTYAVPPLWREEHGIRKYGFHGFAHDYAQARARELLGEARTPKRVLSCHLGSGSSLAAIVAGLSVDTTMGFTPLDGLVMATRPGSLDPGALMWLLSNSSLHGDEISEALEHASGLTGLTGRQSMQEIIRDAGEGDERCALAFEVWLHRLTSQMGSMIAVMGGVDAIVFGGGIGENLWQARQRVAGSLGFLGIELNERNNRNATADAIISTPDSRVAMVVVNAREDLAMIRRTTEAGIIG